MIGLVDGRSSRGRFLAGAAAAVAAGALPARARPAAEPFDPADWASVRAQFPLADGVANFATFLLAAHPEPVAAAIERHRRALDRNPKRYLDEVEAAAEARVRQRAAAYLHVLPNELALTDSTTMGLGLLYAGLRLRRGQEVLTTTHDFYATHEALRLRAARSGARVRKVQLYANARTASVDEIMSRVRRALRPATRALAVTWVHSSTGVKLPIPAIARALRATNADRSPADRVLLCVDGVHGFGVEAAMPRELGCDFLVSGCHKWLFGPRGTGLVWGRTSAWRAVTPTIPTFDGRAYGAWIRGAAPVGLPRAAAMTPGGFHSFEHRWALAEAFEFRAAVGAKRAASRTQMLASRLKQGLAEIKSVRLVTPASRSLSAGLVCFELQGRDPQQVVDELYARAQIVASVTPYARRYVRFGPSIANTPEQVDQALRAIRALA